MARVPRSREVLKSIRNVSKEVKLAIKGVNQLASAKLGKGNYLAAQHLIETAKRMAEFQGQVKALASNWRGLASVSQPSGTDSLDSTKLWEYYKPILRCLIELGGKANKKQIIERFQTEFGSILKDGDLATNGRGIPKWQRMIHKARKPMLEEEFIESENLLTWAITAKGRRAAKSE